jgi:hypothetical protein
MYRQEDHQEDCQEDNNIYLLQLIVINMLYK